MLKHSKKNGFTLIEALVVLAISSMLLTGVLLSQVSLNKIFTNSIRIDEATTEVLSLKRLIDSEIRECGQRVSKTSSCLDGSNQTAIIANNGDINSYYIEGDSIYLEVNGTSATEAISGVSSFVVEFLNSNGTNIMNATNADLVRYQICMTANICSNSTVRLRNKR